MKQIEPIDNCPNKANNRVSQIRKSKPEEQTTDKQPKNEHIKSTTAISKVLCRCEGIDHERNAHHQGYASGHYNWLGSVLLGNPGEELSEGDGESAEEHVGDWGYSGTPLAKGSHD